MTAMQLKQLRWSYSQIRQKGGRPVRREWRFKEPLCFQELDWTVPAEQAGHLARPTDPQSCEKEKHVTAVSAWVSYSTEMKQKMTGNRRRLRKK